MRTRSVLTAASIAFAFTCANAQTTTGSFLHGGVLRDYRLYVPAIYNASVPVPLIFNLHGYTSDAVQQEFYADFRPIADTANFILVHPNGTLDPLGNRFWDTFGAGTVDDLGFLTALIDTLSAHYNIDPDRVYSTGMSNGGFMSYDLACFRSERIAAIASVTGNMLASRLASCAASHPTPVMQIHGTADPTVNYNGGSGMLPIEDLVAHWVQFNNCSPTPTVTQVPNTITTDGCTAEHRVFGGGDAGSTVEFYKVIGGGHTWPGSPIVIGVTNQDFSARVEIWRFFRQYGLGGLTGIDAGTTASVPFTIVQEVSGDVVIRFPSSRERVITLFSATGGMLAQQRAFADRTRMSVNTPGVYVISVQEGDHRSAQRIVCY